MIKGISGGRYMIVSGGSPSSTYYQNNGAPMAGMTRYYNNNLEVYDGNMWQQIGNSYATVGLTTDAETAISWALTKMAEEANMKSLSEEHPAVKAAYENFRRAEEQLKATIILSKDEEPTS